MRLMYDKNQVIWTHMSYEYRHQHFSDGGGHYENTDNLRWKRTFDLINKLNAES